MKISNKLFNFRRQVTFFTAVIVIITAIFVVTAILTADFRENDRNVFSSYISLTTTSNNYKNYFYSCNLTDYSVNEEYVTDDTAQYPLGVVDKNSRKVYYTHRFNGLDQIVSYDVRSKQEKQLTKDFYAINVILPIENHLYILARTVNSRVIGLIKLNCISEEYEFITDEQTQVVSMSYCKINNSIYLSAYNWDEQMKLNDEFAGVHKEQESPPNAKYTVLKYECNSGKLEKILTTDLLISKISISPIYENIALIKASHSLFGKNSLYLMDLDKNEIIKEIKIENIDRTERISLSENGMYFTGIKTPDASYNSYDFDSNSSPNSLFYMDFENDSITEIVGFESKYINNFVVFLD